jgi:serine/threonine protein kinase
MATWNHILRELEAKNFHEIDTPSRVGRSARVLKATDGIQIVALKQFQYSKMTPTVMNVFVTEAQLFALPSIQQHPNIVQCHGYWLSPSLSLVMEWAEYDLYHLLLSPQGKKLEIYHKQIITELASAGHVLHSNSLLHRDIKPNNILFTSDFHVKLCDFGLTISLKDNPKLDGDKKGTSGWAAPEIMGGFPYGFPADIFSFGMSVWSLLSPGVNNPFCGLTSSGKEKPKGQQQTTNNNKQQPNNNQTTTKQQPNNQ